MRENLYIQKLWNSFMRKKMEKEMRNSAQIDEAFKAIKTATGVTDVQDLVKKFLTREQTYSSLLVNVSESEGKTDKLKKDNDELRMRLNELQIDSESNQNADDAASKFQDEDILEMNRTIASQKKDFTQLQEKYKKINIVNDQVSGWAKRVFAKFSALTDDPSMQQMPSDMVKVFASMEHITCTELKAIREKQDAAMEPDDAFIDLDFATEDFINKNIRVRPISGVSKGDETRDGRQSAVNGGQNQDENEEAQDNYNKLAIYEIENQRKSVKKKKEEYLAEMMRKQALEEKKAQKK